MSSRDNASRALPPWRDPMLKAPTLFRQLFAIGWLLAGLAASAASDAATIRAMANNNFVTATAAGTSFLTATTSDASTWEQYQVINNANGTVSLQAAANNLFVSADLNLGGALIANRTVAQAWEQFIIDDADGTDGGGGTGSCAGVANITVNGTPYA